MARIKIVSQEEATGRLKAVYDELIEKRGQLAEVHMIQSLRPESIMKHIDLYMEIMYTRSKLSRAQREMIAVIVSAANQCEYCQMHHGQALNHYWKNWDRVDQLRKAFRSMEDLNEKERALCEYAEVMTLYPGSAKETDHTLPLKQLGFDDSAILDATLVIAYFNFVNRIVMGLDVELEVDAGSGYKY
jgi:uncharacterized peroxidase-related enzyme